MICTNSELQSLDAEMSQIYFRTLNLASGQDRDQIQQLQRSWIAYRNACSDIGCIRRVYNERITALSGLVKVPPRRQRDLSDLIGKYTFRDQAQCGSLTIDEQGIAGEDYSCSFQRLIRITEAWSNEQSFETSLLCQFDDPGKVVLQGTIALANLNGTAVLGLSLMVSSKDRGRIRFPALQLFGKCSGH